MSVVSATIVVAVFSGVIVPAVVVEVMTTIFTMLVPMAIYSLMTDCVVAVACVVYPAVVSFAYRLVMTPMCAF